MIYITYAVLLERVYHTVTVGCPAEHSAGFKNGGLKKLLQEARSRYEILMGRFTYSNNEIYLDSPSFINCSEGSKASTIKQTLGWYTYVHTHTRTHTYHHMLVYH